MKSKWLGLLMVVLLLGLLAWWASSRYSLESIAQREQSLRTLIAEHPVTSWVLGLFLYAVTSLVPGTRGKAIIVGWLYGFWSGLVMVNFALTAAALAGFWISRRFLHDAVAERYPHRFEKVNRAIAGNGAMYVIILRIVPLSFSVVNYLLGATRIRTRTYWWATQLGMLPGNIVFVLVGVRVPSLTVVQERGLSAIMSPSLIAALVVLSVFTLLTPLIVRRFAPQSPMTE